LIEDLIIVRGACTDQWWPVEDDNYDTGDCTDQRHPPGMPDVMGWDRLGSNPVMDVVSTFRKLAQQAGVYMIHAGNIYGGKSDHRIESNAPSILTTGPGTLTYGGQTMPISGFGISGAIIDEAWEYDPTIETPQTQADILAWKKSRGHGPSTEKFEKRGRKKK
jgi:hypothetical protein